MTLYNPQQHRASAFLYGDDAGMICHRYAAWALWYLGYPDQGLARNHEAVTLAQQSAHPFSLVLPQVLPCSTSTASRCRQCKRVQKPP